MKFINLRIREVNLKAILSNDSNWILVVKRYLYVWNIPLMEKVIKERFKGKYPARKSIQTEFAHRGGNDGLQFQLDAIAYKG